MNLNEPQDYKLKLLSGGSYELRNSEGVAGFSKPASTRGVGKLYTISHAGTLIYVGIAQQPMSARLNYGFKANGKGGYHGYKWKHLSHTLALSIWTASKNSEYVSLREMETIEAEVAFLCRKDAGQRHRESIAMQLPFMANTSFKADVPDGPRPELER